MDKAASGSYGSAMSLAESLVERLGTMPDAKLARETGVSVRLIYRERRQRGIPSHGGTRRPHWQPPPDFAERVQASLTLNHAARDLGVCAVTVLTYVNIQKIPVPPCWSDADLRPARKPNPNPAWLPQVRDRLGHVADADLAAEVGVSRERIRQVRNQLEIPLRRNSG